MDENVDRFADTCALNNIVIGYTFFTHKMIHKTTWVLPHHLIENQIDRICMVTATYR